MIPLHALYGFFYIKRITEGQYYTFRVQVAGEHIESFGQENPIDNVFLNTSRMIYGLTYSWYGGIMEVHVAGRQWFNTNPYFNYRNKSIGLSIKKRVFRSFYISGSYTYFSLGIEDTRKRATGYYNQFHPTMHSYTLGIGFVD